jgi:hydroxypyruvate reductase
MKKTTDSQAGRELLARAYHAAVDAADPGRAVLAHLPPAPAGRLLIVGAGKAAAAMAQAAEQHYRELGQSPAGLIIAPEAEVAHYGNVQVATASHPLPDQRSVSATRQLLALLEDLEPDDLVICLLSGGGSALMNAPDGISLAELVDLSSELLRSGADIGGINIVRSHLCRVKGGGLAAAASPARVVALVISDVVGDDLATVASGPTVPAQGTFAQALEVLDRHAIEAKAVRNVLQQGRDGLRPGRPKAGSALFDRVQTLLVASAQASLEAAAASLAAAGYCTRILSDSITGDSRQAARFHAALTRQVLRHDQPFTAPCALISGGETTVTIGRSTAVGTGGRNSDFALALALDLWGEARVHALAADTDGIDGSAPVAGSFVTPLLWQSARRAEALAAKKNFDSHGFFAQHAHQLITGPTGTNVNDLRIILIGDQA